MALEKITITNRLLNDIIERRKEKSLSAYFLSIESGHSKYWLSNIESKKTKKISKDDLYSIYKIILNTDDNDDVTSHIENILNQQIGDEHKDWYELINISNEFSEIYDSEDLDDMIDYFLQNHLFEAIRNKTFAMSVNQKQATLTALQNLYYSLFMNHELAFALINIPVYGVKKTNISEYKKALNDLLAINAKYNDLVIKNNSTQTIKEYKEFQNYYHKIDCENINLAFRNFEQMLLKIQTESKNTSPDIYTLKKEFVKKVSFLIEQGQPNVLKHYLKSFRFSDGKGFAEHIFDCFKWFDGFQYDYNLPHVYSVINFDLLFSVCTYLDDYGEIKPH